MKLFRGVAATLIFLVGLITIAGALFGLTLTMATAQQTHQPIVVSDLITGLVAGVIGIALLVVSRMLDPDEGGPVQGYRNRRRKARTGA